VLVNIDAQLPCSFQVATKLAIRGTLGLLLGPQVLTDASFVHRVMVQSVDSDQVTSLKPTDQGAGPWQGGHPRTTAPGYP